MIALREPRHNSDLLGMVYLAKQWVLIEIFQAKKLTVKMDLPLENGFGKLAIRSTVVLPKTSLLEEQL
jgi:hypothetical protein